MDPAESFKDKTFVVSAPDVRVRRDDDLTAFALTAGGQVRTIPQGSEVRIVAAGSQSSILFGRAATAGGDEVLGWTSNEPKAQAAKARGTFRTPNVTV